MFPPIGPWTELIGFASSKSQSYFTEKKKISKCMGSQSHSQISAIKSPYMQTYLLPSHNSSFTAWELFASQWGWENKEFNQTQTEIKSKLQDFCLCTNH